MTALPSTLHTIALFAPSGGDLDSTRAQAATRYFEGLGHRVVDMIDFGARDQRFAADDDGRLAGLARVVADPTVDVAIALRGGYGLTRLLPRIDFAAVAAAVRGRGLKLVGYSDFTALELALFATTGAPSLAGPMAGFDFGAGPPDPFVEARFWDALDGRVDFTFATPGADLAVDGVLWGGNLAMIASLAGTPWLPRVEGGILFIEDVNEHPYRIERMLLQLAQAGVLARQRAVVIGDFTEFTLTEADQGYDLAAALAYVQGKVGVPFVQGLPYGHGRRKTTMIVGRPATLTAKAGEARLVQRF